MRRAWRGGLAALVLVLAGCAQLPGFTSDKSSVKLSLTAPPKAFRLEGRVSVKAGEESFSGGLAWHREAGNEELLLSTPLGQGVAELRGKADGVTLTDAKGKVFHAPDADALVHQALGLELPLRGLAWWVVGHPRPDAPFRAEADEAGRLGALDQDTWHIEFSRYAPQGERVLPGKLVASRGENLEVRLVVDHWELP